MYYVNALRRNALEGRSVQMCGSLSPTIHPLVYTHIRTHHSSLSENVLKKINLNGIISELLHFKGNYFMVKVMIKILMIDKIKYTLCASIFVINIWSAQYIT